MQEEERRHREDRFHGFGRVKRGGFRLTPVIRARLRPRPVGAVSARGDSRPFFRSEGSRQILWFGPAHPIQLQHFPLALGGLATGPQHQQHCGDQGASRTGSCRHFVTSRGFVPPATLVGPAGRGQVVTSSHLAALSRPPHSLNWSTIVPGAGVTI